MSIRSIWWWRAVVVAVVIVYFVLGFFFYSALYAAAGAMGENIQKMNDMVFQLQPDILVNNRNKLAGDFGTPEQRIEALKFLVHFVGDA